MRLQGSCGLGPQVHLLAHDLAKAWRVFGVLAEESSPAGTTNRPLPRDLEEDLLIRECLFPGLDGSSL